MLIYLAAPYSNVPDKDKLMEAVMKFSGQYMLDHPGHHIVSPLFNHYSLHLVPEMGGDYTFWKNYSRDLLSRCDRMIMLTINGEKIESTGVDDELNYAMELNLPHGVGTRDITID